MSWRRGAAILTATAVLIALVALLFWRNYEPSKEANWAAVSPYYMAGALKEFSHPSPWSAAAFCLTFDVDGAVSFIKSCAPFYAANPGTKICGVQNLAHEQWHSGIIKVPPEKAGAALAAAMQKLGCTQVIVDIESLPGKLRERFSQWSAALVAEVRRQSPDAKLILAVHAKTEEPGTWDGAIAQDWKVLCATYDELLIMAYDFHTPGSTAPGETAPLAWVAEVLTFARTVCPAARQRLGLAAYGYDWKTGHTITEREAHAPGTPSPFIETAEKRQEKIKLAHSRGITKFFLWAAGM